jgi:hypothetical protein
MILSGRCPKRPRGAQAVGKCARERTLPRGISPPVRKQGAECLNFSFQTG